MTYAALCQEWGLDPAHEAEVEDPWLAWQLRLGLSDALHRKRRELQEADTKDAREAIERQEHAARIDRARRQLGTWQGN